MTSFDSDRQGTGTAEWAEVTENICRGCANNCLYCYAAHNANRFNQRTRADWSREEFTKRAAMGSYPARGGVVMFPSSHDITPFNVDEYIRVAKLILSKGNQLLIVTKPRKDCMLKLLGELMPWQSQILFRFTIGSISADLARIWEPGAPHPYERLDCLVLAKTYLYATSVSIEPMLGGFDETIKVVGAVMAGSPETIWIGKMNKIRLRVADQTQIIQAAIAAIEQQQKDSEILRLVEALKDNPVIRWKDSIKQVIANHSKGAQQ